MIFVIVVAIAISGAVIDKFVNPITIAITTTIASHGTQPVKFKSADRMSAFHP